jgi:hypothetical protein
LLDQGEAAQTVTTIKRIALMLDDPVDPEPVLRDRSDDYLLALARSAKAEARSSPATRISSTMPAYSHPRSVRARPLVGSIRHLMRELALYNRRSIATSTSTGRSLMGS